MKRLFPAMLGLLTVCSMAWAQPRFFATGSYVFGEPRLFEIDIQTGAIISDTQTTGIENAIGQLELKGLEFTPDGTLYGFTHVPYTRLWTVDPDTAQGSPAGPSFLVQAFEGGIAPIDNTTAYMTTGNTGAEPYLLLVDLVTGVETLGPLMSRPSDVSGLTLRDDGLLVGLDARGIEEPEQLVTIDPQTGVITTLAELQVPFTGNAGGISVLDGYGYFIYSNSFNPFTPQLWRFDLQTGEQIFLTQVQANVNFTSLAILPPSRCASDLNGSGTTDTEDLGILLGAFGGSVEPGTGADLNDDGIVDTTDLGILLGAFGSVCP